MVRSPLPSSATTAPSAPPSVPPWPAWVMPVVMGAITLVALATTLLWPTHRDFWLFIPFTFLGNSLAPLPYDGAVIYLGAHYPVWLVVSVGVAATVVIEAWNMELLARSLRGEKTQTFRNHRLTRWSVRLFGRAPFWSLVATGCLPIIPHYPMRILATLGRYPLGRYQLSVVLGRGLRYTWLGALGWAVPIPAIWIVLASLVLMLVAIRGAQKMNREGADEVGTVAGVEPEAA